MEVYSGIVLRACNHRVEGQSGLEARTVNFGAGNDGWAGFELTLNFSNEYTNKTIL
jgi:hypothetical protein